VIKRVRRLAAGAVAGTLLGLVACDLWVGAFRSWWDRHAFTGSVVSSLLVVAVTVLIVDEVVADRQRRDRGVTVAVQGLIVYSQTRRAYEAVTTAGEKGPGASSEELRTLTGMLLTAAPSLFDDPVARHFLEQAEKLTAALVGAVSATSDGGLAADARRRLDSGMAQVQEAVAPLAARISVEDRSALEGSAGD